MLLSIPQGRSGKASKVGNLSLVLARLGLSSPVSGPLDSSLQKN
jgi:hypothetical protein